MGWDNTTEQTANVVDSIAYLTRLFVNTHTETPNTDPVPRVPRPGEPAQAPERVAPAPASISLADFTGILKEHQ